MIYLVMAMSHFDKNLLLRKVSHQTKVIRQIPDFQQLFFMVWYTWYWHKCCCTHMLLNCIGTLVMHWQLYLSIGLGISTLMLSLLILYLDCVLTSVVGCLLIFPFTTMYCKQYSGVDEFWPILDWNDFSYRAFFQFINNMR